MTADGDSPHFNPAFWWGALLAGFLCASTGWAQAEQVDLGSASIGLDGSARAAWPTSAPALRVLGTVGYGNTERLANEARSHHGLLARVGLAFTPGKADWLSVAAHFDTRLAVRRDEVGQRNLGYVGEPHVWLRGGGQLTEKLQLGGDLHAFFNGGDAPSLEMRATVTEVRGLLSYELTDRLSLLVMAGGRLDFRRNAISGAPESFTLSHRVTSDFSDYHAVLAALGLVARFSPSWLGFAELSADVLVGKGSPSFGKSPLRASLGARTGLGASSLTGELAVHVSLSGRPPVGDSDPLVPIEPRVSLALGLRYGYSLFRKSVAAPVISKAESEPELESDSQPQPESESETVKFATLTGKILDAEGRPLPDTSIQLTEADSSTPRGTRTDRGGGFLYEKVPHGSVRLSAAAIGFKALSWEVLVEGEASDSPPQRMVELPHGGILHGLTRSFTSAPVAARIEVLDARGQEVAVLKADAQGHFELPLETGTYRVRVRAEGYRVQTKRLTIRKNTVSVLNIDLHEN